MDVGVSACEEDAEFGPPLALVPGAGALMRENTSAGEVALARCLANVTLRVTQGTAVTILGPAAEAELLGWDAEAYRRALDAKPA